MSADETTGCFDVPPGFCSGYDSQQLFPGTCNVGTQECVLFTATPTRTPTGTPPTATPTLTATITPTISPTVPPTATPTITPTPFSEDGCCQNAFGCFMGTSCPGATPHVGQLCDMTSCITPTPTETPDPTTCCACPLGCAPPVHGQTCPDGCFATQGAACTD